MREIHQIYQYISIIKNRSLEQKVTSKKRSVMKEVKKVNAVDVLYIRMNTEFLNLLKPS
jgi:hypothetical protein